MLTLNSSVAIFLSVAACQDAPAGKIRELVIELGSDRIEKRAAAFRALKRLGTSVVPSLKRARQHSNPEVSSRARQLLRVIQVQERLSPNLKLSIPGIEDRLAGLSDHGWTQVFLEIVDALKEQDEKVLSLENPDLDSLFPEAITGVETDEEQWNLLIEVRRRRLHSAGPGVVRMLGDDDEGVCKMAAHTLLKLNCDEGVPELIALLRSDDPRKRGIPIWALKKFDLEPFTEDILKVLRSKDYEIRRYAAKAVGELKIMEACPLLLDLLVHEESGEMMELAAARSLGKLAPKGIVPEITPLLRSDEECVRWGAATALGELEARSAVPELARLVRDPNEAIRLAAITALGKLDTVKAIPHLRHRLDEGALEVSERMAILRTLAEMGHQGAVPGLMDLLKSDEWYIRSEALSSLALLSGPGTQDILASSLEDEHYSVRYRAAFLLGEVARSDAAPILRGFMKDPKNSGFREAAASSLCLLKDRAGAMTLIEAVENHLTGLRSGPIDDEEGDWAPLNPLNALRQPQLWEKLKKTPITGSFRGSTRSLVSQLARQAGLTVEIPETKYWKEEMWLQKSRWIRSRRGQISILEALEDILPGEPYAFLLQPGRIRVLGTWKAIDFWKKWAKEENLK